MQCSLTRFNQHKSDILVMPDRVCNCIYPSIVSMTTLRKEVKISYYY